MPKSELVPASLCEEMLPFYKVLLASFVLFLNTKNIVELLAGNWLFSDLYSAINDKSQWEKTAIPAMKGK